MLAKGERAYSLVDERQRGKRRLRQGEKLNFRCRKARETRPLRGGRTGTDQKGIQSAINVEKFIVLNGSMLISVWKTLCILYESAILNLGAVLAQI
ncbi:hypothetical protein TNCV_179101 [Trichonephila clavipes]|nr:hypothetical protein TNCV_179101 [Trichonephila clavipes]